MSTAARARYLAGVVDAIDGERIRFVLPNEAQRKRCEKFLGDVETGMSSALGRRVSMELAVGETSAPTGAPAASSDPPAADDEVDVAELTDADTTTDSVVERINDVFPGAEVLTPES